MRKIEFINNAGRSEPSPVTKTRELAFRDLVFKEEYKGRKARFGQGLTWVRFLPAIKPSVYSWMMPVEIHRDMAGVTFVSPRTFDSNSMSPVDVARIWFHKNNRGALSSRDKNPNGFKLYSQRYGVSWILEENAPEGQRLKLFYASLYDGVRGGTTGLAFNVRKEAESQDNEPGSPTLGQLIHGDITDPSGGRLVKIERGPVEKDQYASYTAGIGKNPAPIDPLLAMLTDEEMDMIAPLESTLYVPSNEEMHDILRRYIGEDFHHQIFGEITETEKVGPSREEPEPASMSKPTKPAAAKAPTPAPAPEPTPAKAMADEEDEDEVLEPTPKTEPAKASADTKYTTREVTALLGQGDEGIKELLANKPRLSKAHLEIVLDSAKEAGVEA
jgi:hypothetical protein